MPGRAAVKLTYWRRTTSRSTTRNGVIASRCPARKRSSLPATRHGASIPCTGDPFDTRLELRQWPTRALRPAGGPDPVPLPAFTEERPGAPAAHRVGGDGQAMGATVIDHEQPEPEVRLRFKTATCAG